MKHFTIKFALVLFLLVAFAFESQSQIFGTNSVLSVTANTATVVDPGLTITETGNITDMTVQVMNGYISGGSGDILSYTGSLPSGISANFDNARGVLSFNGTTSASNWQALLRTVTLKTTNAACYSQKRNVTYVLGNKFYNPENGHYYELGPIRNWNDANDISTANSYFGRQGYLGTITTLDENNFLFNIVSSGSPWLGGVDDYLKINSAIGTTIYSSQALSDGNFYWITGPEAGIQISTKNSWESGGTSASNGQYMNWEINEPNDFPNKSTSQPGEENFIHLLNTGTWNDMPSNQGNYFIIEYGDMPNDNQNNNIAHSTRNIIINGAPSGAISGDMYICSGSNSASITLTAPSGGYSSITRWESSLDRYFTNPTTISNTTTTLNLSGLTQDAYYRAIVNTSSPACSDLPTSYSRVTLNNANGTWKGISDEKWSTASNWCGGIPTISTDVIINSNTPFSPKVDNNSNNNKCRNLKINSAAYLIFHPNERLNMGGAITSNHAIDATNGEVSLEGSSAQILNANAFTVVNSANTLKNLRINNNSGVTLAGNLTVTNLSFSSGILYTTASSLLSIADGAGNISGAGSTMYVNGPLRKYGKSNGFIFEVGKSGKWAPCALDNYSDNSTSQYFTAEYYKNPFNPYNLSGLSNVSGKEMWNISRSGSSAVSLTLYSYDSTFSGIKSNKRTTSDLMVAHWNSGSGYWEDLGGTRSVSTSGGLTMVTMEAVNSFSPFTFGSPTGLNPLPVKLINFIAIPDAIAKTVELNWETASEENCKYFDILHSVDFVKWEAIGRVDSKGNSNQLNRYAFNHLKPSNVNHYKLKVVEMNGDYANSDIKTARFSGMIADKVTIYPNPSFGTGSITITNASEDSNFEITDLTGKTIQTGNFSNTIEINNLPKGVYIIKVVSEETVQNEKIIIQ